MCFGTELFYSLVLGWYLLGSGGAFRAATTCFSGIGALVLDCRVGCVKYFGCG